MVNNFIKHIFRSSLMLCVHGSLLFFLTISSSSICPGQEDFADFGMTYRIPDEAETDNYSSINLLNLPSSSLTFMRWVRYPAEEQRWLTMNGDNQDIAYYRDVSVAGEFYISDPTDGDTWVIRRTLPDGSVSTWSPLTFHASYNGETNCFVTSSWTHCNTKSIIVPGLH